jgi:hypothetical protein
MTTATAPKTEAEERLAIAAAAEATARAEADTWSVTHRDLDTRNRAIVGELATIAGDLRAGRMAELTGSKVPGLAALAAKQKALETEAAEVAARLEIAASEAARTHDIFARSAETLAYAQIAVDNEKRVAEAFALDAQIADLLPTLAGLLNRRHELETAAPYRWDDRSAALNTNVRQALLSAGIRPKE